MKLHFALVYEYVTGLVCKWILHIVWFRTYSSLLIYVLLCEEQIYFLTGLVCEQSSSQVPVSTQGVEKTCVGMVLLCGGGSDSTEQPNGLSAHNAHVYIGCDSLENIHCTVMEIESCSMCQRQSLEHASAVARCEEKWWCARWWWCWAENWQTQRYYGPAAWEPTEWLMSVNESGHVFNSVVWGKVVASFCLVDNGPVVGFRVISPWLLKLEDRQKHHGLMMYFNNCEHTSPRVWKWTKYIETIVTC